MMSRFLYVCLVVVFLCRCSGDGALSRAVHSYFVCGESSVHDGHAVVELLFHADGTAMDFCIGMPELIGEEGHMRCGVEEHIPLSPHIHHVRLLDASVPDTLPARTLLMELEHNNTDSLTLEIGYSFVCESDSTLEWGNGAVRIPFSRDGRRMHHRFIVEDVPLLPFEDLGDSKGKTQRLLLRLNRLLM